MKKFAHNLKNNYIYLLQAIIPIALFFIPIYSQTFVTDGEQITTFFNVFDMLNFSIQPVLASIVLVLIVGCVLNFLVFLIYMWDGYKLPLVKKEFNIFLLVVNCFVAICCLGILGYAIYLSMQTGGTTDSYYFRTFCCGGIILAVAELVLGMFLIRKNYKKELEQELKKED